MLEVRPSAQFTLETSGGEQPTIDAEWNWLTMDGSAAIHGSQEFKKLGSADLYIFSNNPYSGVTTVSDGQIVLGNQNGLGASGAGNETVVDSGASVSIGELS